MSYWGTWENSFHVPGEQEIEERICQQHADAAEETVAVAVERTDGHRAPLRTIARLFEIGKVGTSDSEGHVRQETLCNRKKKENRLRQQGNLFKNTKV